MKIFMISLIMLMTSVGFSFQRPTMPKMPVPPTKKGNKTLPGKKVKPVKRYNYNVEVVLAKGSRTKGTISIAGEKLQVVTKKGDFTYKKEVMFSEVKRIIPQKWRGNKIERKGKSKNEISYVFYPVEYRIITSERVYSFNGRLPQFESFKLTNMMGKTTIYSIFYDYWVLIGKGGQWHNSHSPEFKYNQTNPHPLSLKEIIFETTKEEKKEVKKE